MVKGEGKYFWKIFSMALVIFMKLDLLRKYKISYNPLLRKVWEVLFAYSKQIKFKDSMSGSRNEFGMTFSKETATYSVEESFSIKEKLIIDFYCVNIIFWRIFAFP